MPRAEDEPIGDREDQSGKILLRVLSGARAGLIASSDGELVRIGREAHSELRLDPVRDIDVSARHAEMHWDGTAWTVADVGSRNGTYVNSRKISSATILRDGDRISLGRDGPQVEFRSLDPDRTVNVPAPDPTLPSTLVSPAPDPRRPRESERQLWWRPAGALLIALLGGSAVAGAVWRARREPAAPAERPVGNLALRQPEVITTRADRAVAKLFVELRNGDVFAATAFAVRSNGTLLTSAHSLLAPDGTAPIRVAVQFSFSKQVWPARVLIVDNDRDIAVIKVDHVIGAIPVVRGLNARADTVSPGTRLEIVGFPEAGGAMPSPNTGRAPITPKVEAGTLTIATAERIEVLGPGAKGSSGSPIFDARGEVVGIVFGGRREKGVHYLIGTPAYAAIRLLWRVTR